MSGESRVIVTCMKNECPYILEWVAYHLNIGFTHFVVATNDCSDGTIRMLKNLERAGLVTHVPNPAPHPRGPQKTGYYRCRNVPAVRNADWLMTLDADEFVHIYTGDGTLDDLFAAAPDANLFSLQWQMFGHNGQIAFEDRPVMEQFTRAAHPLQILPTILRSFKTVYRSGLYQKLGTHRPNAPLEDQYGAIRWVDGSGRKMPDHYIKGGWAGELNGEGMGIGLGRIHHYAVRSLEAYTIKRDRGDVNPARHHVKNRGVGLEYWQIHDWNVVEDKSILKHLPAVLDKVEELKEFGFIRTLHDIGVNWHRERAAALSNREDMVQLKLQLIADNGKRNTVPPDFLRPPHEGEVLPPTAMEPATGV